MDENFAEFIEALVLKAPVLLVLFGSMVYVGARWERHPVASVWAALGFGWLILLSIAGTAWRTLAVPELFPEQPPPLSLSAESFSYLLFSGLESLGVVCLVVAVCMGGR